MTRTSVITVALSLLALILGTGWLALVVIVAVRGEPVQTEVSVVINTLGGGLLALISGWAGHARARSQTEPDE